MQSSRQQAGESANCRSANKSWSDSDPISPVIRWCPMALQMTALAPYESRLRSVARIVIGFTFSLHGWQKFFGAFGGLGGFHPPLSSMLGIAGVLETIGGALIIVGLFTRPV